MIDDELVGKIRGELVEFVKRISKNCHKECPCINYPYGELVKTANKLQSLIAAHDVQVRKDTAREIIEELEDWKYIPMATTEQENINILLDKLIIHFKSRYGEQ